MIAPIYTIQGLRLRAEHRRYDDNIGDGFCAGCANAWPCDTKIVLDALKAKEAEIAELHTAMLKPVSQIQDEWNGRVSRWQ